MNDRDNVLILVFDGLGAAALGCYGSNWAPTPGFDRLAAESTVYDFSFVESADPAVTYRGWLDGAGREIPPWLDQRPFHLVTDDPAMRAWEDRFEGAVFLDSPAASESSAASESPAASELGQTQIARMLAAVAEAMETAAEPWGLWLHAQALAGVWDAPTELGAALTVADELPPAEFTTPPCRRLPEDYDPDERWRAVAAYAAQVQAVDAGLDALRGMMAETGLLERTTMVVASPRGFPIAAGRRQGFVDGSLYEETAHVPLLVRRSGDAAAAQRVARLTGPADFSAALRNDDLPRRPAQGAYLLGASDDAYWLRTPVWLAKTPREGDADSSVAELYAKPDDRWEANNVAIRAPEVVAAARAAVQARLTEPDGEPPPLPSLLLQPHD